MPKKLITLLVSILLIAFFRSPIFAQVSNYRLEPSDKNIILDISQIDSSYGINVLLYKQDQLLMDQTGITYKWTISNPEIIKLTDSGFDSGCPNDIHSPCPNLHADIKGLKPGSTKITVDAYLYDQFLSATNIFITVYKPVYTLEPSEKEINTQVHRLNEGYGVSVKLLNDGQLVNYQPDISYTWAASNSNIELTSQAISDTCPYGIYAPCPNLNASFRAKKTGETTVNVVAYKQNQEIAKTSFLVKINDAYEIDFLEKSDQLEIGKDYPILIILKKNGQILSYIEDVEFNWQVSDSQVLWLKNYELVSGCPQPLVSPCSNISASVRGLKVGNGKITVKAKTEDGLELVRADLPIQVIGPSSNQVPISTTILPTYTIISTPVPTPMPPTQTIISNTPIFEGEKISLLEQSLQELSQKLDQQKTLIENQNKKIEDQAKDIAETQSILQKIWNFLVSVFNK